MNPRTATGHWPLATGSTHATRLTCRHHPLLPARTYLEVAGITT